MLVPTAVRCKYVCHTILVVLCSTALLCVSLMYLLNEKIGPGAYLALLKLCVPVCVALSVELYCS